MSKSVNDDHKSLERKASKQPKATTTTDSPPPSSVSDRRVKRGSVTPQNSTQRSHEEPPKSSSKKKKEKATQPIIDEDLSLEDEQKYVSDPKESTFVDHLVQEPIVNLLRQLSLIRQHRWKIKDSDNDSEILKIVKSTLSPELGNLIAFLGAYNEAQPTHLTVHDSVKGVLVAENQLNIAQDNIRTAVKQGQLNSNLLDRRNQARSKFIASGTQFYDWMNNELDLDQLEISYRANLSQLEAEVALARTNNFDFVAASISNPTVNQERVQSEVSKALTAYTEWQTNYATYLRSSALKTEEQATIAGHVLNQLQNCFSNNTVIVDDENAKNLYTAEKMKTLTDAINEEYQVMYDGKFTGSFPTQIVIDAVGYIIRDYKIALQELDQLREIEKRLAVVLNEVNDWEERPKIEDNTAYQQYVAKRVAAASLKKEVAFLEFQMKDLSAIDQFDTEANIAEAKKKLAEFTTSSKNKKEQLRKANQEAEISLRELADITQVHFPELPSVYPKLDIEKFTSSDRLLLENRTISDYSSIQLIKDERNQIYNVILDGETHILKEFKFIKTEDERISIVQQSKLVQRLQNPNLGQIEAIFFNRQENSAYVQMPFYSEGNLVQFQKTHCPDELCLRHVFRGVLRGLAYLHHYGVVHCNICPTRIVVQMNPDQADISEKFTAKILPWDLPKSNEDRCVNSTAIAKSKLVGNIPEYVAPELTRGEKATTASDMFSFGLVMFDLHFVFKEAPGGSVCSRPTFLETMKNDGKIEIPKGKERSLVQLLTSLLNPVPKDRFSARDALDHSHFATHLDKSTEDFLRSLNSWRNDQDKKSKLEETALLNERHAFFQRTSKLHTIRHKVLVQLNNHRLQQLAQQLEWARKPDEDKKQSLRKERINLERKQKRVQDKIVALEDEKKKWREKFYVSSNNRQRNVVHNWNLIVSQETQAIARPPHDWITYSLGKFTTFRFNVTDQFRDLFSNLVNGITLASIERVESSQLWQKYVQCRETLAKFGTRKRVAVSTDEQWVHTTLHTANYVNEVLLWHPVADESMVHHVISQGFELRLADLRGAFGTGVYFWENLEAILSEVKPNSDNVSYIVLSRVCLGTPHVTSKFLHGITSPPFSIVESKPKKEKEEKSKKTKRKSTEEKKEEKEIPSDEKEDSEPEKKEIVCDSVIAKLKSTAKAPSPRQFIIYDRFQAYPQFIVGVKLTAEKRFEKPAPEVPEENEESEDDEKTGNDATEQADDD